MTGCSSFDAKGTVTDDGFHDILPEFACDLILIEMKSGIMKISHVFSTRSVWICAACVWLVLSRPLEAETLEQRLKPLIESHDGQVSVSARHLETGEAFAFRADEPMPTASLIKFPVMIEAYRQAGQGRVDLATHVVLREEDKVPGSGILTTHFSAGAAFPLRDAVRLMVAFSDNTATN